MYAFAATFWVGSYVVTSVPICLVLIASVIVCFGSVSYKFIIGFFLGAIPWYVGLFILACSRIDPREKPGYFACTIAVSNLSVLFILNLWNTMLCVSIENC
ncbi:hypothetical protein DKX38_017539 [Salix brachista]|uniref:Uncharacterized protein n=1 Tax=Salix brachista TaxID=2182728 RepID=A0A5N5KWD4_9ROSI|nr:hypothetical protein DKX38_017527 [Salix brachista]KAB5534453.1 hypothetical protein DKX38_017539 [Salix brachista]